MYQVSEKVFPLTVGDEEHYKWCQQVKAYKGNKGNQKSREGPKDSD